MPGPFQLPRDSDHPVAQASGPVFRLTIRQECTSARKANVCPKLFSSELRQEWSGIPELQTARKGECKSKANFCRRCTRRSLEQEMKKQSQFSSYAIENTEKPTAHARTSCIAATSGHAMRAPNRPARVSAADQASAPPVPFDNWPVLPCTKPSLQEATMKRALAALSAAVILVTSGPAYAHPQAEKHTHGYPGQERHKLRDLISRHPPPTPHCRAEQATIANPTKTHPRERTRRRCRIGRRT